MRSMAMLCGAFLCLSLTACGDNTPAPASSSTATTAPVTATAPEAPVTVEAPPAPTPVADVVEPVASASSPGAPETPPSPAPGAAVDAPSADVAPAAAGDMPGYTVNCPPAASAAEKCQVDKDTYVGWRTFAGQCQVCHGGSGLGSTFAPNLLDRLNTRVDHARFVEVVTNGYTGQVGAMPGWKGNPNVMPHVDAIYRYLKARADGRLPPGRPERIPAS